MGYESGSGSGYGSGYGQHIERCEREQVVEKMDGIFPLLEEERAALLGRKMPVGLICNCFSRRTGLLALAGEEDMTSAGIEFVTLAREFGGVEFRLDQVMFHVLREDQLNNLVKKPKTRAKGRVRGKTGEVIRVDFGSRRRLD